MVMRFQSPLVYLCSSDKAPALTFPGLGWTSAVSAKPPLCRGDLKACSDKAAFLGEWRLTECPAQHDLVNSQSPLGRPSLDWKRSASPPPPDPNPPPFHHPPLQGALSQQAPQMPH